MIGFIGISGKVCSYLAGLFDKKEVVGFDKIESLIYTTFTDEELFFENKIDIIVDFSNSDLSKDILIKCLNKGIKVISGTSNIPNLEEIKQTAINNKVSFIYLDNFSKGINQLTDLVNKINFKNCEIIEEHYYHKKDVSQTAITLSKKLNNSNISSIRTLKKESNHYIKYYLDNEEITIIHKCYNYEAYKEVFLMYYNKINKEKFYIKCGI